MEPEPPENRLPPPGRSPIAIEATLTPKPSRFLAPAASPAACSLLASMPPDSTLPATPVWFCAVRLRQVGEVGIALALALRRRAGRLQAHLPAGLQILEPVLVFLVGGTLAEPDGVDIGIAADSACRRRRDAG